MFSNKSQYQIKIPKVITRYLKYIEELYQIINKNIDHAKIDKKHNLLYILLTFLLFFPLILSIYTSCRKFSLS